MRFTMHILRHRDNHELTVTFHSSWKGVDRAAIKRFRRHAHVLMATGPTFVEGEVLARSRDFQLGLELNNFPPLREGKECF